MASYSAGATAREARQSFWPNSHKSPTNRPFLPVLRASWRIWSFAFRTEASPRAFRLGRIATVGDIGARVESPEPEGPAAQERLRGTGGLPAREEQRRQPRTESGMRGVGSKKRRRGR